MKEQIQKAQWELKGHSYQIADTGDYDGHYEITNGKVSLFTYDDDDEALQPIVDAFNASGCKFWLDDSDKVEAHLYKLERDEARAEVERLQAWKAEAIACTPDWQAIGKALNLQLGTSVSEQVLPAILRLKAERDRLLEAEQAQRKSEEADKKWALVEQLFKLHTHEKVKAAVAGHRITSLMSDDPGYFIRNVDLEEIVAMCEQAHAIAFN